MRFLWMSDSLIRFCIGVGVAIIAYVLIMPNSLDDDPPSLVVKIIEQQRAVSNALEAYQVDQHAYPGSRPLRDFAGRHANWLRKAGGWDLETIDPGQLNLQHGLTTPVAYMPALPADLFAKGGALPMAYYCDGEGWLLFSAGPDWDYDIQRPSEVYHSSKTNPAPALIELTYDPTNGVKSSGDIIRVKQ